MKKILIPTDFSTTANYAISVAVELAQKTGASLYFFHVVDIPVDWTKMTMITPYTAQLSEQDKKKTFPELKEYLGATEQKMNELIQKVEKKGIKAYKQILHEFHYADLTKLIKDFEIDLIVMGSEGAEGIREIVMGSHAQKFVRVADCPVLTIKKATALEDIQHIVFASDFEIVDPIPGFNQVMNLTKLLSAKLHLLYVNTPANFQSTMLSTANMNNFIFHNEYVEADIHIYNAHTVEDGIIDFSEYNKMDLVALATHGFKGVKRFFYQSITENIVNHATNLNILSMKFD